MRKLAMCWAVLTLASAATAAAGEEAELKTEEQKTLYALGLAISRSLGPFNLSARDLEAVEAGRTDGGPHKAPKGELETPRPHIPQPHAGAAAAAGRAPKKANPPVLPPGGPADDA